MENSLNKKFAFNLYEPWTLASQVLSNFPSESITWQMRANHEPVIGF